MFQATANTGAIVARAQSICQTLRDNLNQAEAYYQWVSAQLDSDFTSLPAPLSEADITLLRSAFADLHALYLLCYGHAAPASYNITGTYDFSVNIKEVVGAG